MRTKVIFSRKLSVQTNLLYFVRMCWNPRTQRHGLPLMCLCFLNVLSKICTNTDTVSPKCIYFFFRLCWVKYANTQTPFPHNAFIFFDCVEWNTRTHRHGFPIMHLFFSIVLSEIREHPDTVSPWCVYFVRLCWVKYANTQTRFPHDAFIFFDCVEWNTRTHRHGFPMMRLFCSIVLSEMCEHTDTVSPWCVYFVRLCWVKCANTQTQFPHDAFILFDCVEWNMRTHRHGFPMMRLFCSIVLSEIREHTDTVSPWCVYFVWLCWVKYANTQTRSPRSAFIW